MIYCFNEHHQKVEAPVLKESEPTQAFYDALKDLDDVKRIWWLLRLDEVELNWFIQKITK